MNEINEEKFSSEFSEILEKIKANILKSSFSKLITPEYFMKEILMNNKCAAYKIIDKIMFSNTINRLIKWYSEADASNRGKKEVKDDELKFDHRMIKAISEAIIENNEITSSDVMYQLVKNDTLIGNSFKLFGVDDKQIQTAIEIENYIKTKQDNVVKDSKSVKEKQTNSVIKISNKAKQKTLINEVEKNLTNLNALAADGKINESYENDELIFDIFSNLQKKNKNNVILVGDSGCGKTCVVEHIANLIVREETPKQFYNKILVKLDFNNLLYGTGFRGSLESKFNGIISDAKKNGNYIFFIDDIHRPLGDIAKYNGIDTEGMLLTLLSEPKIKLICTTNHKGYKNCIEGKEQLKRRFQKIIMETPSVEKTISILNKIKYGIEQYHNVKFDDNIIRECVKLSKRFISDSSLPDSCINVIDKIGAVLSLKEKEDKNVTDIKDKLFKIQQAKNEIDNMPNKNYDIVDELTRDEIKLKSELKIAEKNESLSKIPHQVNENELKEVISSVSGVTIQDLEENELIKLKNINNEIKKNVIGQDKAVDTICNAIKKKKLGISNQNKPAVFLFAGKTGTGKTLLAKQIAKEVYGDEKYLVRLDMSEYSEKTSVTKLYGSSAGYVGYDNGGILTEAVKKNKNCVLLLDEIEKANEEVYNVFLQLFDEGRLTDNTGYVVDFKNVIIIMTSNVGAKEIEENGNGIGFNKNNNISSDTFRKAIKKKFKPEFINRINKIIYFNDLNEIDIKSIIKLEIEKLENRLNDAEYYINEDFYSDKVINLFYEKVQNEHYGARSIIRLIETEIEDKIVDIILNKNISKGYIFNVNEVLIF